MHSELYTAHTHIVTNAEKKTSATELHRLHRCRFLPQSRQPRIEIPDAGMSLLLTPTRKLRDELLERVRPFCESHIVLPLGATDGGDDLSWNHGIRLLEQANPELVKTLKSLKTRWTTNQT